MSTPQISLHHSPTAPHILVMDESREVLSVLHEILTDEGFSLTLSSQLLDLEQIRICSPALILMERRFDGLLAPSWDLVRRTRRDPCLAHVPIVLSTTHHAKGMSASLEQELWGCGVQVLLKPYGLDDLLSTIEALLTSTSQGSRRLAHAPKQGITLDPLDHAKTACLDPEVRALLFPDGRVVVYDDPLRQLAHWQLLGRIRQDGELLSFLRIDAAGRSWTALVPSMSLEQKTMPLCVPLLRQSESQREPLSGWPLFS
jgi:CheY-like chemotaxis protein